MTKLNDLIVRQIADTLLEHFIDDEDPLNVAADILTGLITHDILIPHYIVGNGDMLHDENRFKDLETAQLHLARDNADTIWATYVTDWHLIDGEVPA